MNKILSKNGYSILKDTLNKKELDNIINDLTVKPRSTFDTGLPPESFKIFRENKKRIFLPKNYGLKKFGNPEKNKINSGEKINIKFNGSLRDSQKEPVKNSLEHLSKNSGGILSLECAAGKCFKENTKILLYDGTIKNIQDIIPGDLLMGDDSTPRLVKSISSGYGKLFKIKQSYADDYIVNKEHILSVVDIKNKVYDVKLDNYLKSNKTLFGYKKLVNYKYKKIDKDPYTIGYNYNSYNYISKDCLLNSSEIRYKLLTGIIDKNNNFINDYIVEVFKQSLKKDIIQLVNSLGLSYKFLDNNLIKIFGYNLNFIFPKKIPKLFFNNYNSKINIEEFGEGRYYGLVTDNNHRFLLSDSTVVHNTVMGLYIGAELKEKILVIVHTNVLLDQWRERIEMFLPNSRIGKIQGNIFDIDDKDIVIGMLQTIVSRNFSSKDFNSFGTVIFDECHHLGAKVFSQCFYKVITNNMIGLSATVNRKDGLSKVFKYFIGDIMYSMKKKLNVHDVCIKAVTYNSSSELATEIYNRVGNLNLPGMLNNIVKIQERNNLILNFIKKFIKEKRKIILLSHRISHLKMLKLLIEKDNICSAGLYIGGMKLTDLNISKTKDILLGSYNMVSEGFDEPSRNTLILSTPLSDVQQSAGRILRKKHDIQPIILDIIDNFSIFSKQWKKRKTYFKKEKWEIDEIEVLDNELVEGKMDLNLEKCLL
jgi:superfamily II DNA or RNA helicase